MWSYMLWREHGVTKNGWVTHQGSCAMLQFLSDGVQVFYHCGCDRKRVVTCLQAREGAVTGARAEPQFQGQRGAVMDEANCEPVNCSLHWEPDPATVHIHLQVYKPK